MQGHGSVPKGSTHLHPLKPSSNRPTPPVGWGAQGAGAYDVMVEQSSREDGSAFPQGPFFLPGQSSIPGSSPQRDCYQLGGVGPWLFQCRTAGGEQSQGHEGRRKRGILTCVCELPAASCWGLAAHPAPPSAMLVPEALVQSKSFDSHDKLQRTL